MYTKSWHSLWKFLWKNNIKYSTTWYEDRILFGFADGITKLKINRLTSNACAFVLMWNQKLFLNLIRQLQPIMDFGQILTFRFFFFFLFIYLFFNFHFYRIYDDKLTHSVYLFRSLFYYIYRVHLRIFQYTNAHSVWYSENLAYLSNFRTATICEIVLCSTHINENNDNNDDVNDGIGNVKYACLAHTFYFKFKIIPILGLLASSLSLGWQENERWKQ